MRIAMPLNAIDQRLRQQEEEAGRVNFNPLKGAMIGAGRFARFQAEAWSRVEGARIVAVADAAPGRAEEFSERFGIPRAYRDAAEMLEGERPDFVDIVTRPDSPFDYITSD